MKLLPSTKTSTITFYLPCELGLELGTGRQGWILTLLQVAAPVISWNRAIVVSIQISDSHRRGYWVYFQTKFVAQMKPIAPLPCIIWSAS